MILTILLLFELSTSPLTLHANTEEIKWTERRQLAFSDFNGEAPASTPWAALTSSYVYFTYGTTNGKLSRFSVYASFRKKESWIKVKNEEVLNHEQLHFDITEVFARKLYREAALLKDESGDIPSKAKELFSRINGECEKMQELYDDETQHGTVIGRQTGWNKKVNELLKQYEPYPD